MRKKIRKILALALMGVMAIVVVSCGKKPKFTPEESLNAYMGIVVNGKKDEIEKLDISEDQFNKLMKLREVAIEEGINSEPELANILDKDSSTDLISAMKVALGKIECNAISSNIEKDMSYVDVEIKTLDMDAVVNNTIAEITKNATYLSTLNEDEVGKAVIKEFTKQLENAPLVKEKHKVTIKMIKDNDGQWIINDDEIESLITSILK